VITDFLDSDQLQNMIRTWSNFSQANGHLIENTDKEDQSTLVQAFIETNMSAKASIGQKFLFGKLKDQPRLTRPTTLKDAFGFIVTEFRNIRKQCQTAFAIGYRMSTIQSETQSQNHKKQHISNKVLHSNIKPNSTDVSRNVVKTAKPATQATSSAKSSTACHGCGVIGHTQADWIRRSHGYFNRENCEFKDSAKWSALQQAYPRLAEVTRTPQIPNKAMLANLDKLTGSKFGSQTKLCKSHTDNMMHIEQCTDCVIKPSTLCACNISQHISLHNITHNKPSYIYNNCACVCVCSCV
jgi:hypothetical protein